MPTLEHNLTPKTNAIYCVTLLYAWDEIKKAINTPLEIEANFKDLLLLNKSESHIDALSSDEYNARGGVEGSNVFASAEFSLALPFKKPFYSYDNLLQFDSEKVASFGFFGEQYEFFEMAHIMYYENNDLFIIKLLPENQNHEILLFKTRKKFQTMKDMLKDFSGKIEVGKNIRLNDHANWKYNFLPQDELLIPKIRFNIETNYKTIEGSSFKSGSTIYNINTAYQRTAFILDEKGAIIESEAVFDSLSEEDDLPTPKIMRFDKPYFIILRKKNQENPYFCSYIYNTELMEVR